MIDFMSSVRVGVGEMGFGKAPAQLVTYALGPCVGLAAWDPKTLVGGMLHSMLPESSINPARAQVQPGAFCDSALEHFLKGLSEHGALLGRCRFWLAGGASATHFNYFDIGRRNVVTMKKLLWGRGLLLCGEDTGGELSRTFRLDLSLGKAMIRSPYGERELGVQHGD